MTREAHILEAERLLDAAKEVARTGTENNPAAERIMLDLMSFARLHAEIAQALREVRP